MGKDIFIDFLKLVEPIQYLKFFGFILLILSVIGFFVGFLMTSLLLFYISGYIFCLSVFIEEDGWNIAEGDCVPLVFSLFSWLAYLATKLA